MYTVRVHAPNGFTFNLPSNGFPPPTWNSTLIYNSIKYYVIKVTYNYDNKTIHVYVNEVDREDS